MTSKILIVDDQTVMLRLLSTPLEREGYTVVTAMTGVEALQKIQSESPDLVILDIMLPDTSGIDVCRRVRQVLNLVDLPIILLSGQTELESKIQGLEAGADDYVTKPVDPKEMVARVKAILVRTRRQRQTTPNQAGPSAKTRMGVPIAIIGAKGGVGVTTLVANLAAALSMRGNRTIAVELRPYFGTLARHFGVTPSATLGELVEMMPRLINDGQIGARLLPVLSGLHVLVGPQQLKDYREIQVEQVEALLNSLVHMAAFILMDLPHMPSVANRAALRAAQLVILVVEPDPGCAAAAQASLEILRAWGIAPASVKIVVVNRMQATQSIAAPEFERILGCELLGAVTAAPDLAMAAITAGKPFVTMSPTSLVAGVISEMADRLASFRYAPH